MSGAPERVAAIELPAVDNCFTDLAYSTVLLALLNKVNPEGASTR